MSDARTPRGRAGVVEVSLRRRLGATPAPRSAREQRADVGQQFVGADGAVAAVFDEAVNDLVDAAQLVWVGRLRGGRYLHNVFQVGEDFLFNRLLQALVRGVLELPALARVRRNPNQNLLAEGVLRVLADPDLLLDGAHQLLVRLHLLFGNRVFDLLLVAVGLDVVEVVVADGARHLLERVDEGALHLGLRHLVVLLAGRRDEVEIALALVGRNPCVLLEAALDRAQTVNLADARDAIAHERRGEAVDDVAGGGGRPSLAPGPLPPLPPRPCA